MSKSPLDDDSDHWKTIIRPDTINAGIIVLIGLLFAYIAISGWYYLYYPRVFIILTEPEIVYPIRLMASLLTCFYGVRLFLGRMKTRTAIILSFITLIGVNIMTLLLW